MKPVEPVKTTNSLISESWSFTNNAANMAVTMPKDLELFQNEMRKAQPTMSHQNHMEQNPNVINSSQTTPEWTIFDSSGPEGYQQQQQKQVSTVDNNSNVISLPQGSYYGNHLQFNLIFFFFICTLHSSLRLSNYYRSELISATAN